MRISSVRQHNGKSSFRPLDLQYHIINAEPPAFVDRPALMKLGSIPLIGNNELCFC
jgi:hypothetical protein